MLTPKCRTFRWILAAAAALATSAPLGAQTGGGQDDNDTNQEKKILVAPGKGPQIQFDEQRWEFWWYYNKEPHIGLRESLLRLKAGQANVDVPFQPLQQDERESALVATLVASTRDSNPEVRASAVLGLGKTKEPAARFALGKALGDADHQVRLAALVALGVASNTSMLTHLENVVKNEKAELSERVFASVSIGLVGGPQAVETMRQFLAPTNFTSFPNLVQIGLAYAIGLTRDPENAATIRALLSEKNIKDAEVRSYLVLSLGKVGTAADPDTVAQFLADPDGQVRRSAAIGLGVVLRKNGGGGAAASAVKKLVEAAKGDADQMVRSFALISLGYIGGTEADKVLLAEAGGSTKIQRPYAALALGLLGDAKNVDVVIRHFESESEISQKGAFAIALGMLHDAKAAPALRKAFKATTEPVLKGYIGLALGMVGDVESVKDLRKAFLEGNDVEMLPNLATALGLLGARPTVDEMLVKMSHETNEFVKQSVVYSVGLIGDRAALARLADLVKSEKEIVGVRSYAAVALGLLGDEEPIRAIARISVDSNYTQPTTFLNDLFSVL